MTYMYFGETEGSGRNSLKMRYIDVTESLERDIFTMLRYVDEV